MLLLFIGEKPIPEMNSPIYMNKVHIDIFTDIPQKCYLLPSFLLSTESRNLTLLLHPLTHMYRVNRICGTTYSRPTSISWHFFFHSYLFQHKQHWLFKRATLKVSTVCKQLHYWVCISIVITGERCELCERGQYYFSFLQSPVAKPYICIVHSLTSHMRMNE